MSDQTPNVPTPQDDPRAFPPPRADERAVDPGAVALPPAPRVAPIVPSQPEKPRKGSFLRGLGLGSGFGLGLGATAIVGGLVATLVVVGLGVAAAAGGSAGTAANLTTVWGTGAKTLRAIPIQGAIMADGSDGGLLSGGTYGYEIADQLDALTVDDSSGVVLLVNTPGGSISGSKAIADAIERYQERTEQKVLVHVSSMSASGGVYATAPADEIVSDHGTLIGSIGVIMGPFYHYKDATGLTGNLLESGVTTTGGVTSEYLTAGTGKDFGNPFRAITEAERAHYQAGIDVEYAKFVDHVSTHRDIPSQTIIDEFGAFMFDPDTAKANGLIDEVLGRDEFFRHAAEAAGLDPADTRVEMLSVPTGWESLLGISADRVPGYAPPVDQGPGMTPVLSSAICSGSQPLAFAGDLSSVCG